MGREAALFRVQGPRGIYYAVYESAQQSLFTEANEKGARDHAAELGLTLFTERTILHAELMRLTGRDAPPVKRNASPRRDMPKDVSEKEIKPLVARLPSKAEISHGDVLKAHNFGATNPFASVEPLKPEGADPAADISDPLEMRPSDALSRDVINFQQIPRSGRHGNPFSDRAQK